MSLESNKSLIRRWIEAWRAGDMDAIERLFAPDYEVNGRPIGIDGVKQGVGFLHSVLADVSAEVNDMVAEGDKVALRWTVRGNHSGELMGIPPSGNTLELTGINVYEIREGKIAVNHEQTNMLELIAALKM